MKTTEEIRDGIISLFMDWSAEKRLSSSEYEEQSLNLINQFKSDVCKKQIDPEKDAYYHFDEIEYNFPNREKKYEYLSKANLTKQTAQQKRTHSWVSYADVDICAECWKSRELAPLRKLILQRGD